jgi:formylglycine-generating enzyme required for sulfatase activity
MIAAMPSHLPRWCVPAGCLVLAACGDSAPGAPPPRAPTPMTAAAREFLTRHADATTWTDLDPARPGHRLRDPRTGITFRRVPAGEFVMGGTEVPNEQPPHAVRLTRDWLCAETELTVGQWRRHTAEHGGDPNVPVPAGDELLPMPLSCRDAVAFVATYGYRLPTEAEWERACRGGLADGQEPWRDEAGMRAAAWFHRNSDSQPHPVGTRAANPFGLHDMLGNLWEWCDDTYVEGVYAERAKAPPAIDPRVPPSETVRVLRGGSWFSVPPARPATRSAAGFAERTRFFGLRPAAAVGG